jgi:raffinose/stachyose/melibiose transport system permease protein
MRKKKASNPWSQNDKIFLVILVPILALFFCFNTLPLIKGFYYGLTNFKGYGDYDFVGLRNFIDLFQDVRVGKSVYF